MIPALPYILTIALACVALIVHLAFDFHNERTKTKIVHTVSAGITIVVAIMLGFVNQIFTDEKYWQFVALSLGIHFALFDPIWNWLNGQKWYYNGDIENPDRAFTDKIWDKVPPLAQPLFRFIGGYLGFAICYQLQQILQ